MVAKRLDPVIPAALSAAAVGLFVLLLLADAGAAAAAAIAGILLLSATALAIAGWRAARDSERRLAGRRRRLAG